MTLNNFVLDFNYFVLIYFLVINGVYLILYAISFAEIADYVRREVFSGLPELFTSNYAPPVSVVVPAYNEEAAIADSVRSFLTLHYPLHQVVVVNDGSKDGTLDVLMEEFNLYESDQPVRVQLDTAPLRGVYASETDRLLVVDKENGGKADALNVGICAASYPLVCCMDADIILEEDALLRIARPHDRIQRSRGGRRHHPGSQRLRVREGTHHTAQDTAQGSPELPDRRVSKSFHRQPDGVEQAQLPPHHLRRVRDVPQAGPDSRRGLRT